MIQSRKIPKKSSHLLNRTMGIRSHGGGQVDGTTERSKNHDDIASAVARGTGRSGPNADGDSGIAIGSPCEGSASTTNHNPETKNAEMNSGVSSEASAQVVAERLRS